MTSKTKCTEERDPACGYIDAEMVEVSDNPEWTEEMFAGGKPFAEAFPDLAASIKQVPWARRRGRQPGCNVAPVGDFQGALAQTSLVTSPGLEPGRLVGSAF